MIMTITHILLHNCPVAHIAIMLGLGLELAVSLSFQSLVL